MMLIYCELIVNVLGKMQQYYIS